MLHYILRGFLVLALLAVGMSYVEAGELFAEYRPLLIIGALVLAGVVIAVDMLIPRKSLQALAGLFFGLTVGLLITYSLVLVLNLLVSAFVPSALAKKPVYQTTYKTLLHPDGSLKLDDQGRPITEEVRTQIGERDHPAIAITKVLMGMICCYFCVSFILQTKDDLRFVIPYVEFSKQLKGQRPIILDTSVIIDGRIVDICETGIIDQKLIVPRFVLLELQAVADSNDRLKRNRGRRGLDVVNKLQTQPNIDLEVYDARLSPAEEAEGVDLKLLSLAQQMNGRVATNDYNLNKLAKVRGVHVININDLANALKPVVLPGEGMTVKVIKPGEEPGQGIGYLDDGTMVVIEQGRPHLGETVEVAVTSTLQTSAGRMIFGRVEGGPPANRRRPSPQQSA